MYETKKEEALGILLYETKEEALGILVRDSMGLVYLTKGGVAQVRTKVNGGCAQVDTCAVKSVKSCSKGLSQRRRSALFAL